MAVSGWAVPGGGGGGNAPGRSGIRLADLDSNQDKQNQNLLCYRYTIGQDGLCAMGLRTPEGVRGAVGAG